MKRLPLSLRLLLLCVAACAPVRAQDPLPTGGGIPAGVMTAAATTLDPAGRPMAYLNMVSPQPETLRGRTFSVYLKPAAAQVPGEFSLQGAVEPVSSPAVATALIDRAVRLGQDRAELERAIRYLYRKAKYPNYLSQIHRPPLPGDPPWPDAPAQPGEPPLGEQAVMLVTRAAQDTELTQDLDLTSLVSPGMSMLYGRGWGGALPTAGQQVTLEVRLRENGIDGQVVGRVELLAGVPLKLPAPGAPVQVPNRSNAGHLAIGLRWASPVNLRRLSLLGHGFKLYRVNKVFAETSGMVATPPGADILETLTSQMPESVIRLSNALHLPPKVFLEGNVADFTNGTQGDPSTTFHVDRNERCCGQPEAPPFTDGMQFYYFAVACDLLGQPGFVSPAGPAQACATLSPLPPNNVSAAVNTIAAAPTVEVAWDYRIGEKTAPTRFEILRGVDAQDPRVNRPNGINQGSDLNQPDPALLVRCGFVSTTPGSAGGPPPLVNHQPDADGTVHRLKWTDPNPPLQPGQSCWYAVRAVYQGACGTLYSDPTAGQYVSLRRAIAPAPPDLCYQGNGFPFAVARAAALTTVSVNYPANEHRARVRCVRENTGITHVKFEIRNGAGAAIWQQTAYFANTGTTGNNTVQTEVVLPVAGTVVTSTNIYCTAYSETGAVSRTISQAIAFPATPASGVVKTSYPGRNFVAGAFSLAALPPSDSQLRGSVVSSTAVTGTATAVAGRGHATAVLNFGALPAVAVGDDPVPSVLLEIATPTGWQEIGGARLSNSLVIVPREYTGGIRATLLTVNPPAGCEGMVHQREGAGGAALPVTLGLCLTPNTEEYRVYRQVGTEAPRLIQQGAAKFGSGILTISDRALPAVSSTVQYFTQLVDGDGNASPLKPLLVCPLKILTKPPVPVLQKLRGSGTSEMTVAWHCPSPGVERFQIFVETGKGRLYEFVRAVPQGMLNALLGQNAALAAGPAAGPAEAPLDAALTAPGLSLVPFTGNTAHLLNPAVTSLLAERNFNTRSYYTNRTGPAGTPAAPLPTIGIGPTYSLNIPMNQAGKCRVWVKSIGPTGGVSAPSNVMEFTWRSPPVTFPTPEPRAAWPARALPEAIPGSQFTIPVSVIPIPPDLGGDVPAAVWPDNEGERYLRGVVIGGVTVSEKDYIFDDSPHSIAFTAFDLLAGQRNPNLHLSGLTGLTGDRVLPAVLYRRQIPSTEFPEPPGDVVQVSPLITNIANYATSNSNVLVDPFIGVIGSPHPAAHGYGSFTFCILDTHTAIEGAAYQYFLVRFDDQGEMRDVIEAGTTTINP